MNRVAGFFSLAMLVFVAHGPTLALDCPKMPEQINKDWEVEVEAAIAKIGPAKGGELKTRTNNATKDLLGKLPNAGKVYLEQMMYSAYCSALRDDKTIRESEKAKLLKEYNREARKAMTTSPASVPKPATKPLKNQTEGDTKPQAKLETATPKDVVKSEKNQDNSSPSDNVQTAKPNPPIGILPAPATVAPSPSKMSITCYTDQGLTTKDTVIRTLVFSEDNTAVADVNVRITVPLGKFQTTGTSVALGKTGLNGTFTASWDHPSAYNNFRPPFAVPVEITATASKIGFQECSVTCKVFLWVQDR
jgi:hypothetical protein